eukprot:3518919-Rhodomonas_salina.4
MRLGSRRCIRIEPDSDSPDPSSANSGLGLVWSRLTQVAWRWVQGSLFLDTPLFNAHTTAVDAIWAGLPLVTTPTERMVCASRICATRVRVVGSANAVLCGFFVSALLLCIKQLFCCHRA